MEQRHPDRPTYPRFLDEYPGYAEVFEQVRGNETTWCIVIGDSDETNDPLLIPLPAGGEMSAVSTLNRALSAHSLKLYPPSGGWGPEVIERGRRRRRAVVISVEFERALLDDWGTWEAYEAALEEPLDVQSPQAVSIAYSRVAEETEFGPARTPLSASSSNSPDITKSQEIRDEARLYAQWGVAIASLGGFFMLSAGAGTSAGFYEALRWLTLVFGVAALILMVKIVNSEVLTSKRLSGLLTGLVVLLAFIVLTWNPILPIYRTRDEWIPLNYFAAATWGVSTGALVVVIRHLKGQGPDTSH